MTEEIFSLFDLLFLFYYFTFDELGHINGQPM